MNFRTNLLLIFLSAILFVAPIAAQSVSVSGQVKDAAGMPVAGAVIVLRNAATGLERLANTDGEGRFSFAGLSSAKYVIVARANGFANKSETIEGNRADLMFTLEPEALRETVTVYSGSRQAELQESLNTAVNVVTRKEIKKRAIKRLARFSRKCPAFRRVSVRTPERSAALPVNRSRESARGRL